MFFQPPHCPNADCKHHLDPPADFFINRGSYVTKHDRQKVPRYQCKGCKKTFGSRRFSPTARQHKPGVNEMLGNLLASGVTQRRCAVILKLAKVTVEQKFVWLAKQARKAHAVALASGKFNTAYVQFDEMETFERNKMLPISIALAVRAKTGEILSARCARMNCHGRLAAKSQSLYGPQVDTRQRACANVLNTVKSVARARITVATDGKTSYGRLIRNAMPRAIHKAVVAGRKKVKGVADPLFRLNHTCARIRADMSRMGRRTWATTKRMWALQYHLDLYIAFNNGYELG